MATKPDTLVFVEQQRAAGVPEKRIAEALGISPKTLWHWTTTWNQKNPDDRLIRPASKPETPFYVQAAALRNEGLTLAEIAARMGRSKSSVEQLLAKARAKDLIPPKESIRERGGCATWEYYRRKGATPPVGYAVTAVISQLTCTQVEYVLDRVGAGDTLADTLARILKEHLDAEQTPE